MVRGMPAAIMYCYFLMFCCCKHIAGVGVPAAALGVLNLKFFQSLSPISSLNVDFYSLCNNYVEKEIKHEVHENRTRKKESHRDLKLTNRSLLIVVPLQSAFQSQGHPLFERLHHTFLPSPPHSFPPFQYHCSHRGLN